MQREFGIRIKIEWKIIIIILKVTYSFIHLYHVLYIIHGLDKGIPSYDKKEFPNNSLCDVSQLKFS